MTQDPSLYAEFLEEMHDLEGFRREYRARHPGLPLDREDPDIARILEALAYFTVQTRRAAKRNQRATWHRLFSDYFDSLLLPLPAAGLLQAVITEKLAEPRLLPRGTEVRLALEQGQTASMYTLCALRVLPLHLGRAEVQFLSPDGYRLLIELRSRVPRRDAVGELHLHVRHLDDYLSSLDVLYQLRAHLVRAFAVYDEPVNEATVGQPCQVSHGAWRDEEAEREAPLQRIRRFFHHPEEELFLNVSVPPAEREWSRLTLCIDLDRGWPRPRSRRIDWLEPFVVPIVNLRQDLAQPILCDGTQSSYPILPPTTDRTQALHSVRGVYEITRQGLVPLRSDALPTTGAPGLGYEIEAPLGPGDLPRLLLRAPEAFLEPRQIAIDALWYQPELPTQLGGRVAVSLPGRHLEGLGWSLLGGLRPPEDTPLRYDTEGLLHTLSLKMKSVLDRDELRTLLEFLGAAREGSYRRLADSIRETAVRLAPSAQLHGSGVRHIYRLKMERFAPEDEALAWSFLVHVRDLLDAWNPEGRVELELDAGGNQLALPLG